MVKITYIEPDGRDVELQVPEGWSLMEGAFQNGVDGIEAECGGSCSCATCHVYIDEAFLDRLEPVQPNEDEMLECTASERKPNSRLSCQIEINKSLDGIIVHIPPTQI